MSPLLQSVLHSILFLSGWDPDLLSENQPVCTSLPSKLGMKSSSVLIKSWSFPSAQGSSFCNSAKARKALCESFEWVFFVSALFLQISLQLLESLCVLKVGWVSFVWLDILKGKWAVSEYNMLYLKVTLESRFSSRFVTFPNVDWKIDLLGTL